MKTEELRKGIENWITDNYSDYEKEEINNIKEILEESDLEEISELDVTILTRLIDDEDLLEEINKREIKKSENAFGF